MTQHETDSSTRSLVSAAPPTAPATMQAAVVDASGAADVLHLAEIATPVRVNAEVLVRVSAAGINPIDAKTRAGKGVSAAIPLFPWVLGNDFSGTVVESPYEGHPLKPGDEVYGVSSTPRGLGSYAQYVSVPSSVRTSRSSTAASARRASTTVSFDHQTKSLRVAGPWLTK